MTVLPTGPLIGLTPVIVGVPVTVNNGSYTAVPAAVTTRQRPGEGVPAGTTAVICVGETTVKLGDG